MVSLPFLSVCRVEVDVAAAAVAAAAQPFTAASLAAALALAAAALALAAAAVAVAAATFALAAVAQPAAAALAQPVAAVALAAARRRRRPARRQRRRRRPQRRRSCWQQKVANAAGVDTSLVTICVAAASVLITASIAVPASKTADQVQTSLSSTLGTTNEDASIALCHGRGGAHDHCRSHRPRLIRLQ